MSSAEKRLISMFGASFMADFGLVPTNTGYFTRDDSQGTVRFANGTIVSGIQNAGRSDTHLVVTVGPTAQSYIVYVLHGKVGKINCRNSECSLNLGLKTAKVVVEYINDALRIAEKPIEITL